MRPSRHADTTIINGAGKKRDEDEVASLMRRPARMVWSMESARNYLMNADDLAAKFAKKFGFGPTENKDAAAARLASAQEEGKKAFEDIVIPFLREVVAKFPENRFSFEVRSDNKDHRPIGVDFHLRDGQRTAIIVSLGKVAVTFSDFSGQRGVFTIDHAPFISKPSDLTVENISKLIDMAIDHA
jgi:hypothetical protein